MQRLARRRAEILPVGVCDLVIGLPLGVAQALLLGGRERRGLIMQLWRVDALKANGEFAVLDRRRRGPALDLGALEDMGRLERHRVVRAEADRVRGDIHHDLGGVGVRPALRPELADIDGAYDLQQSNGHRALLSTNAATASSRRVARALAGSGSSSCDRPVTGRGRETVQRGLRAERAGHDWSVVQRMLWRRRTILDWCGSLRAAPARNQGRYGQTIVRWSSVGAWSSPLSYSHSSRISCRSA